MDTRIRMDSQSELMVTANDVHLPETRLGPQLSEAWTDDMTTEEFLARLEGVQKISGGYLGRCPAHDDRQPSLGVTEAADRLLIHCYADCDTLDVLSALGLRWRDLWYDQSVTTRQSRKDYWDKPEAEYIYQDEDGDELYRVIRFPGKRFVQKRVKVPYRLPQLLEAVARKQAIYIVEGEKDVHALVRSGRPATTCAGGVGEWQPEWSRYFEGAYVHILQDRDEPGREHARNIAALLYPVAASIRIGESLIGKDAADHLKDGWLGPDSFQLVKVVK